MNIPENNGLENYSNYFMKLYQTRHNTDQDFLQIIETLSEEFNAATKEIGNGIKQVETSLTNIFDVNSLNFLELQGAHVWLNHENKQLKEEISNLNVSFIAEKNSIKQQHMNEIQAIEKKHFEEMEKIKTELHNCKSYYNQREQELYEEIQNQQSVVAIEVDEVQIQYKQQLDEANSKLRACNELCSALKRQIYTLKSQFCFETTENNEKYMNLKKKFQCIESALKKYQENEMNFNLSKDTEIQQLSVRNNKQHPVNIELTDCYKFHPSECADVEYLRNQEKLQEKLEINIGGCDRSSGLENQETLQSKPISRIINEKGKNNYNSLKHVANKYEPLNVTTTMASPSEDEETETFDYDLPTKKISLTVFRSVHRTKQSNIQNKVNKLLQQYPDVTTLNKQENETDNKTEKLINNNKKKRKLLNTDDLNYMEDEEINID